MILQINSLTDKTAGIFSKIKDQALVYAPKILGAILLYLIGSWLIKKLGEFLHKTMTGKHYDPSLQSFLLSFVKMSLSILLLISIFGMLGVDVTAFSALLVGLGIAVGSALNGSLGNFAGGVMLLIFKPFKVGDKIESQGQVGTVKELGIFNTVLISTDKKTIILANGPLSTNTIINYSDFGYIRVEIIMAVASNQDIDIARKIAIEAMLSHPNVLKTPAPEVNVAKIMDGTMTFAVYPFTQQENYWSVYYGAQENIKKAWDAAGITEPLTTIIQLNR